MSPARSTSPAARSPSCPAIARDLERRARQAASVALHLARLREHQRTCVSGSFRVFHVAATRQFVVLRDIAAVDGATCVHECDAFADALAWANQQLAAELVTSTPS